MLFKLLFTRKKKTSASLTDALYFIYAASEIIGRYGLAMQDFTDDVDLILLRKVGDAAHDAALMVMATEACLLKGSARKDAEKSY